VITADEKPAKNMGLPPRMMRVETAAYYLSMSTRSFLRLVESRELPGPIKIRGLALWDRAELDDAMENLKEKRRAEHFNTARARAGLPQRTNDDDDSESENGDD